MNIRFSFILFTISKEVITGFKFESTMTNILFTNNHIHQISSCMTRNVYTFSST